MDARADTVLFLRSVRRARRTGERSAIGEREHVRGGSRQNLPAAVPLERDLLARSEIRWLPTAPKNYQYADTEIAPGRCVKCIFDFDDPQTATIYIMWFET